MTVHTPLLIPQHIVVPEPQHPISFGLDQPRPLAIDLVIMLPPIALDHDPAAVTRKIHDIPPQRHLPPRPYLPKEDQPAPTPETVKLTSPFARHDGWTGECMAIFCEALAETAVVAEACEAAGKHISGAYALRRRNPYFAANTGRAPSALTRRYREH